MRPLSLFAFTLRCAVALLASAALSGASAQQPVLLDGSTGMIPLARALAGGYQLQGGAPVAIGQGLGTNARLKALSEGRIQVALASHGVSADDLRRENLRLVEVARGAIVFAVNASVSLDSITEAQVCDFYSGRVRNWRGTDGQETAAVVLTRPPTEVDPEVIREKIGCFKDLKEVDSARVMPRGGDMAKALADTPHAIGMTSMTVVEQSGGKIRALTLGGVAPSADNVKSGRYGLTRDFYFVVKADAAPAVSQFLEFVLSPAGDQVILKSGAVPLR